MYDVAIIGAGVIGCSIARELSKYELNICVIEKSSDVAEGTSKANSGIVHAGFDGKPGSLKAKLNAKGNSMFDKLSQELDFPFRRNGSLVLCFDEKDIRRLHHLKKQGEENGVPELVVLNQQQAMALEPNLSEKVVAALYVPSGGIVCPYEMTVAMAENAFMNGVEFKFNSGVKNIEKQGHSFIITYGVNGEIGEVGQIGQIGETGEAVEIVEQDLELSKEQTFEARLVINAAGLHADTINNMVSNDKISIIPRKGEYNLFDKAMGCTVKRTIFQLPTDMGKGVLVTPTVDGNLLIGPNAVDIEDKSNFETTSQGLEEIMSKAKLTLKEIPMRYIISSFSGLRAHSPGDDFIIGEAKDVENFINATAIESPGLSCAPSIAEMVGHIVLQKLRACKKQSFNPIRKGIPKFRELSNEERQKLIEKDAAYGRIICRCEMVTEGEIIAAVNRPLGARTLDGIKRRTRAGMGRCQSGFCTPKLVCILSTELKVSPEEITKFGGNSKVIVGRSKEI